MDANWTIVALTSFSVLLVPLLILIFRGTVKWTRTEDKLSELVDDVHQLVEAKDKVHATMLETMRMDRESTDRRLRWLEEVFMMRGRDSFNG